MLDRYVKAFWDKDINAIVGMLTARRRLGDAAVHRVVLRRRGHRPAHRHPVPRRRPRHADGRDERQRPAGVRALHAPARRHVRAVPPAGAHPRGAARSSTWQPSSTPTCSSSFGLPAWLPADHVAAAEARGDAVRGLGHGRRGRPSCSTRAVAYARICLARVGEADLDRPDPVRGWSLRDLLRAHGRLARRAGRGGRCHLALPVPTTRRRRGRGAPRPASGSGPAASSRHWCHEPAGTGRAGRPGPGARDPRPGRRPGDHPARVGRRTGVRRGPAVPAVLAMDLWPVARDHITDADRPCRVRGRRSRCPVGVAAGAAAGAHGPARR